MIIDKIAIFFFVVMAFFLPISNAVIESCSGFILLCFILRSIFIKPSFSEFKSFFKNRINLSLLIFFVFIGFSLFVSGPLLEKSLKTWLFKWGQGILLFYLSQVFLKRKDVKLVLLAMLFSAFLICIDGLFQKISGIDFIRGFDIIRKDNFTAIRATFNHYNDFATFLIVVFFINWGVWGFIKNLWLKLFSLSFSILIVLNLFLTYSRGGWISFLTAYFLMLLFIADKKKRLVFIFPLILFMLCIVIIPSLKERFMFIFGFGGDTDRFRIWKATILMCKDSPFIGKGLGLFMDFLRKYGNLKVQYTHNCYLQILAETGLFGLIPFLWFLGEIIIKSFKAVIKEFNTLIWGLLSAFLAFLIHSFFDTPLFSLKLSILFWLLASFIVVSISSEIDEK